MTAKRYNAQLFCFTNLPLTAFLPEMFVEGHIQPLDISEHGVAEYRIDGHHLSIGTWTHHTAHGPLLRDRTRQQAQVIRLQNDEVEPLQSYMRHFAVRWITHRVDPIILTFGYSGDYFTSSHIQLVYDGEHIWLNDYNINPQTAADLSRVFPGVVHNRKIVLEDLWMTYR
ncbi:MAG: hypothetical protein AAF125_12975 [Chloroflexota bacterium]